MPSFMSSVTIDRPVDVVYQWFLNLDQNAPRVDPEADSATKEPPGETGEGTVFTLRRGSRSSTVTFTELDPGRSIDLSVRLGPIRPIARLSFEPAGEATSVEFRGRSNPVGPLKLLEALVNKRGKREWDARLERIKADLEG